MEEISRVFLYLIIYAVVLFTVFEVLLNLLERKREPITRISIIKNKDASFVRVICELAHFVFLLPVYLVICNIKGVPFVTKKMMVLFSVIVQWIEFLIIEIGKCLKREWINISPYFWSLVCWSFIVSGIYVYKNVSKEYSNIEKYKEIKQSLKP